MTAGTAARAGSQWAGAFTRSESLRGWTLLSPTTILMVVGLALLVLVLFAPEGLLGAVRARVAAWLP